MDILLALAVLAFIVGAVFAFVQKSWALGFVASGLALWALDATKLIK